MKIIAVTNIKGGVGKTTTAVNLAFLSAASGFTTVLWDLDPQGAATHTLRCEAGEGASAKKLVAGKRELPELLVQTGYDRLDVIPSHFSYRNFDVHLSNKKRPTERLTALGSRFAGLRARFHKGNLLLLLPGSRDRFEPAIFIRAHDRAQIEGFVADVHACLSVVDALNLNTRIWSKS